MARRQKQTQTQAEGDSELSSFNISSDNSNIVNKEEAEQEEQEKQEEQEEPEKDKEKKYYCKNADLLRELEKWRDSGNTNEERVISDQLAIYLQTIAKKLTNHVNFVNYPADVKTEIISFGIYKMIHGIYTYNFKYTNAFAFFTTIGYNAALTVVNKYYRHLNLRRELICQSLLENSNVTMTDLNVQANGVLDNTNRRLYKMYESLINNIDNQSFRQKTNKKGKTQSAGNKQDNTSTEHTPKYIVPFPTKRKVRGRPRKYPRPEEEEQQQQENSGETSADSTN